MRFVESEGTWHNFTLQLAWAAGLFDGEGCSRAPTEKKCERPSHSGFGQSVVAQR